MNGVANCTEQVVDERNVADIVRANSDLLNDCRASANCIKNFIKFNQNVNEKSCAEPCGNGANCMYDELLNQTETIKEIKELLNYICITLGC